MKFFVAVFTVVCMCAVADAGCFGLRSRAVASANVGCAQANVGCAQAEVGCAQAVAEVGCAQANVGCAQANVGCAQEVTARTVTRTRTRVRRVRLFR